MRAEALQIQPSRCAAKCREAVNHPAKSCTETPRDEPPVGSGPESPKSRVNGFELTRNRAKPQGGRGQSHCAP